MKKGFTLVEILVAAVIFSIMLAGIFAVLSIADKAYNYDMGLLELQRQARNAMEIMVREVRQGSFDSVTISPGQDRIDFFIPGISNKVSYYLLEDGRIRREHPVGVKNVLANNAAILEFCCIGGASCTDCVNASLLQVHLQEDKTVRGRVLSFSLTERVKLRN